MKKRCILCNQRFQPTPRQERRLWKHPHKIQICPDCYERITHKVQERKQRSKNTQSNPNL